MNIKRIRVLVVDDSAFARKVIREVLERDPEIEVVGIARDGLEALEKVSDLRPDVVTLDLVMPALDGLGFLRALSKVNTPRVVIVSVSGSEAELAIEALQAGAVEIVMKPTPLPTDRLYDLARELVIKVKSAAIAQAPTSDFADIPTASEVPPPAAITNVRARLVVIGTSTGGPQALTQLFKNLPAALPVPVAIALHIPAGYTEPLAARISSQGGMPVVEARHGMELLPGQAVIAPGGQHLRVIARGACLFADVSSEPRLALYHPSVDLLFESAASSVGSRAIGVVLTGMGADGTAGAKAIRVAGGRVLAESKSSCVIYGMPRSVIEAGLATGEAPLAEMAACLLAQIYDVTGAQT